MNKKLYTGIISSFIILVLLSVGCSFIGYNNDQDFQIKQTISGDISVQDKGGYYWQGLDKVWTYPRTMQVFYANEIDKQTGSDDSIRVTFNDGGNAQVSSMIRFRLPTTSKDRITLHRDFAGDLEAIEDAVRSNLINISKATAPLMSASENQSARKSEFTEIIGDQLRTGLYRMKKIEKLLKDRTDENGKPITVWATEIITNKDGNPLVAKTSPLKAYNIEILDFNVMSIDYDSATQKSFAVKKEQFLRNEEMKAKREAEVQSRLMVLEQGKREKAEVEAKANKAKALAVINAQREKEVANYKQPKKFQLKNKLNLKLRPG